MNINHYQKECQRTKSEHFHEFSRILPAKNIQEANDILHAIIGIATEAGELLDPVKKAMFYGKPLDRSNLDEEVGDLLWYIAVYAEARGTTIEKLAQKNYNKLRFRYPDKFDNVKALFRDLQGEREILESDED